MYRGDACRALLGRRRGGFQDAMAGPAFSGAVAGAVGQVRISPQCLEGTTDLVWSFCYEKSQKERAR